MNALTKRNFLKAMALLLGNIIVRGQTTEPRSKADELALLLSNLIPAPEDAKKIGLLYLEHNPGEKNINALIDFICRSSDFDFQRLRNSNPGARIEILERYVADDFAASETVIINDWVLSKTEARLFAVVALLV